MCRVAVLGNLADHAIVVRRVDASHVAQAHAPTQIASMPLTLELRKVAEADFPTRFGQFRIFGFEGKTSKGVEEAVVLKMGDIEGSAPLVRIHSECLTGDVFHSLRCDCRAQLELALQLS